MTNKARSFWIVLGGTLVGVWLLIAIVDLTL
jgi:hypothetical protein